MMQAGVPTNGTDRPRRRTVPLRDHFSPPLDLEVDWNSFHSVWATTIVHRLNERVLPARYRAQPELRLGQQVVVDVAALELQSPTGGRAASGNGAVATAVWAPPAVSRSTAVTFPARDVYEIRVHDARRRLVAASERNKDRPEARRDFAIKCASYLQQQVSVIIVDVVTTRQSDLYGRLLTLLEIEGGQGTRRRAGC
jgi:hypothetical protein